MTTHTNPSPSLRDCRTWSTTTDALLAHEVEMNDRLRDIADAAEDAERAAFEAARIETFCLTGYGHEEIEVEGGEVVCPASESLSGITVISPASATCTTCGTVIS